MLIMAWFTGSQQISCQAINPSLILYDHLRYSQLSKTDTLGTDPAVCLREVFSLWSGEET